MNKTGNEDDKGAQNSVKAGGLERQQENMRGAEQRNSSEETGDQMLPTWGAQKIRIMGVQALQYV